MESTPSDTNSPEPEVASENPSTAAPQQENTPEEAETEQPKPKKHKRPRKGASSIDNARSVLNPSGL